MNLRTVYRSWEEGIRAIVTQLLEFETATLNARVFPFYRADGTYDSIPLHLGTALPFYDAAGTSKPITLVA